MALLTDGGDPCAELRPVQKGTSYSNHRKDDIHHVSEVRNTLCYLKTTKTPPNPVVRLMKMSEIITIQMFRPKSKGRSCCRLLGCSHWQSVMLWIMDLPPGSCLSGLGLCCRKHICLRS